MPPFGQDEVPQYKLIARKPNPIYRDLHQLLTNWRDGYCHTADDGSRVEDSILQLARTLLAMPEATVQELIDELAGELA